MFDISESFMLCNTGSCCKPITGSVMVSNHYPPIPSPPLRDWADFNFEKLKSLGEGVLTYYMVGTCPYGGSDNGNQIGGKLGQNKYHNIFPFFSRKVTFTCLEIPIPLLHN